MCPIQNTFSGLGHGDVFCEPPGVKLLVKAEHLRLHKASQGQECCSCSSVIPYRSLFYTGLVLYMPLLRFVVLVCLTVQFSEKKRDYPHCTDEGLE